MPRPARKTAAPVAAFVPPAPAAAVTLEDPAPREYNRLPAAKDFNWDLPAAETVEYARVSTIAFDAERDTPEQIKSRVKANFARFSPDAPTANFQLQECGTAIQAQVFVKAMRKYCANIEPRLTVRIRVTKSKITGVESAVAYSVRPFEAR